MAPLVLSLLSYLSNLPVKRRVNQLLSGTVASVSDDDKQPGPEGSVNGSEHPSPFDNFAALTRRLLAVSKDELRETEAIEQEKRHAV